MKIGILTFWETLDNYGQVLQGYALQKYLHSLGHEVFFIRYDHDGKFKRTKKKKCSMFVKFLKLLMIYPVILYIFHYKKKKEYRERIVYNQKMNIQRCFDKFRDKYFKYSPELYLTLGELQKNPPKADTYIVGSDQVWGWTLKHYDNRAFFLDFGPDSVKRIAYAPSFAMEDYPMEQKSVLAQLLKHFNAISVREKTGVAICNSVGYDAKWVCDPTMLLEENDYSNLISQSEKEPYIFIYSLNISMKEEIAWSQIESLASDNHFRIVVTVSSGYIPAYELFDNVEYDYATIEQWLSNIYNSQFVVTTSFHGVSLCVILNKNFAFVPLKGKYAKGNNRVTDLLEILELTDHIVGEGNSIRSIYNRSTDWVRTNLLLEEFRILSQGYLLKELSS